MDVLLDSFLPLFSHLHLSHACPTVRALMREKETGRDLSLCVCAHVHARFIISTLGGFGLEDVRGVTEAP